MDRHCLPRWRRAVFKDAPCGGDSREIWIVTVCRDGAAPYLRTRHAAAIRAKYGSSLFAAMAPRFMDALGASSSSDDDDDDAPTEAPRARATRRAITMDALARHGFRGATPPKTRANDATATDWSRGRRGDGAATYAREESARTRRAAGEGLAATCARAIERARAGEEARDEARREGEEARAARRARNAEARRAIREDDALKRARAREETGEARVGRRARIDVGAGATATATAAGAAAEEKRLVESGGFDFGDE